MQVKFLVEEGKCISKGSIAVTSQLHFFFRVGEHHPHCDNCSRENKNKYLLWYLAWRTLHGLHESISLNSLLTSHTKVTLDYCFGLFKKLYSRTAVLTLQDIANCVKETAPDHNIAQLVRDENGGTIMPTYQWQEFLAP